MQLLKKVIPVVVAVVLALAIHNRYHNALPRVAQKLATAAPQTQATAPTSAASAGSPEDISLGVTVVGPLANYMQRENSTASSASAPSTRLDTPSPTASAHPSFITPMDRVSHAPLGPGGEILPARFLLTRNASFSFDVPAHANSPRLTGAYRANSASAGSPASVDFLVLTSDQYAALANGSPSEALFSPESSTGQNVDFALPVTSEAAVRYYVVFRADTKTKKVVSSNLRLEF